MTKSKDKWYQDNHKKEMGTLNKFLKLIGKGFFWVVSVRIEKEMEDGDQYRLTAFLKERDEK